MATVLGLPHISLGKEPTDLQSMCALKGRVGIGKETDRKISAESVVVHVLYAQPIVLDEGGRHYLLSYSHDATAGGVFDDQLNDLIAHDKELKALKKSIRRNPQPDDADRIAANFMKSVDEALTRVRDWSEKNPRWKWQIKTIVPDEKGIWFVDDLQPGVYTVVVRGTLPGYDALWKEDVNLIPTQKTYLPLNQPRMLCRK